MHNQKGQGLMEYLVIVALVAVTTVGIMKVLGQTIKIQFAKVAKGLGAENEDGQNLKLPTITKSSIRQAQMKQFLSTGKEGQLEVDAE